MKTIKTLIAATTLIGTISAAAPAFAIDEYNVSKGTTVDGHGVAFRGNDVVALVNGLGVVPGQAERAHVHDGVAYYFASEEAMNAFAADPETYMPQFGGYCAFGVAVGKKLDGSPRFADIVDGKLYLFLNAAVFRSYEQDKAGILAKAAENWPGMHHLSVAEVNGNVSG
jgi:YHS domain-containing protein